MDIPPYREHRLSYASAVLQTPYWDGASCLKDAFSKSKVTQVAQDNLAFDEDAPKPKSLLNRVGLFILGVTLLIPLINIIIDIAVHILHRSPKQPPMVPVDTTPPPQVVVVPSPVPFKAPVEEPDPFMNMEEDLYDPTSGDEADVIVDVAVKDIRRAFFDVKAQLQEGLQKFDLEPKSSKKFPADLEEVGVDMKSYLPLFNSLCGDFNRFEEGFFRQDEFKSQHGKFKKGVNKNCREKLFSADEEVRGNYSDELRESYNNIYTPFNRLRISMCGLFIQEGSLKKAKAHALKMLPGDDREEIFYDYGVSCLGEKPKYAKAKSIFKSMSECEQKERLYEALLSNYLTTKDFKDAKELIKKFPEEAQEKFTADLREAKFASYLTTKDFKDAEGLIKKFPEKEQADLTAKLLEARFDKHLEKKNRSDALSFAKDNFEGEKLQEHVVKVIQAKYEARKYKQAGVLLDKEELDEDKRNQSIEDCLAFALTKKDFSKAINFIELVISEEDKRGTYLKRVETAKAEAKAGGNESGIDETDGETEDEITPSFTETAATP